MSDNPFSPENIGIVQFIMLARIYDVGMALLREQNPGVADQLLNMHTLGSIVGPSPNMTGQFVTDEMNP